MAMTCDELRLVELDATMEREFLSYIDEVRSSGEPPVPWVLKRFDNDFAAYLRWLRKMTVGLDLPDGFVPNSTFWLVDASGRLLGLANLRHSLTESGVIRGGHVGYEVRPSDRGKGYGTRLLGLTLIKAREMGLTRVLITCDKGNIASWRVIEKNGGRLENEVHWPDTGKVTLRYWIDLTQPARP